MSAYDDAVDLGPGPLSNDVVQVLVRQHEGGLRRLRHWRGNMDLKIQALDDKTRTTDERLDDIVQDIRGVKKLLMWLLSSVTGGAIAMCFSLLVATGRI